MKESVALAEPSADSSDGERTIGGDLLPIELRYIGGPTVTISLAGVTFIVDPTFDAPGGEYPLGAVTLRKLRGPAIAANEHSTTPSSFQCTTTAGRISRNRRKTSPAPSRRSACRIDCVGSSPDAR
jgi:hypothetical protein